MISFRFRHSGSFFKSGIIVVLTVSCILVMGATAPAFDYDDVARDVSDISFYRPPKDLSPLEQPQGQGPVRNVIVMIGDGMGINHVALARIRAAGPNSRLHMERLPVTGLVTTHSNSSLVTDSAASATAIACGIKTHNGIIGMDNEHNAYESVLEALAARGWRTGLVVTSTITHATPAGFSSHVENRGNEREIAKQQLRQRINVVFGGGRNLWLPQPQQENQESDNRDLLAEAKQTGYSLVDSRDAMLEVHANYVLGLFAPNALSTFAPEPTLAEMTSQAIRLLASKETSKGFLLIVEGSQIDWAGHANNTDNCVRQTLLFDMAVKEAIEFAQKDRQTLVVVTADHETGGLFVTQPGDDHSEAKWTTQGHTGTPVPLYAYGPGANHFAGVIDNTFIAKTIASLTEKVLLPRPLVRDKTPVRSSAASETKLESVGPDNVTR